MFTRELAEKYGIATMDLENFLKDSEYHKMLELRKGSYFLKGDFDEDKLLSDFRAHNLGYAIPEEPKSLEEIYDDPDIQTKLAQMLITSGFSFDGYTIKKYSGYISGDDAISVDRGYSSIFTNVTNVGDALMDSLKIIRRNALQELKLAAYELGCNAVIGVDFDYLQLDPETANFTGGTTYLPYVFGVTANGNAVIIEKNED